MDTVPRDIRQALRTFRRDPIIIGLAVLMIALGIGASTAIFSVVDGVLLRPLPYEEPSRLVYLGTTWGTPNRPTVSSIPDFIDWRDRITTLETIAASQPTSLVLTGGGEPERVSAARVSPGLLSLLGVQPALGRTFAREEHLTDAEPVAILTHGFWQRRWGGDPAVVGTTFTGSRKQVASYRVVGILPAGFRGPAAMDLDEADLLLPLPVDGVAYAGARDSRSLRVIGRLRSGVSLEAARQELDSLSAAMAAEHPEVNRWKDLTLGIGTVPLLEMTVGSTEKELLILLAASGVLLLIACANVANLLLARATERRREMALRSALGAGRRRIFGQLLTESIFFSLVGCTLGIWLAMLGVEAFAAVGPVDFPRMTEVGVNLTALGFALGLAVITGVLSGLAPAVLSSGSDVGEALKDGGGTIAGRSRSRLRRILVVAETAAALILLMCAGLLITSFARLRGVDPGFDTRDVLLMKVGLGPSYDTNERRAMFVGDLVRRAEMISGVRSASSIADPPLGFVMWSAGVRVEGGDPAEARLCGTHLVSPGYFETIGIRLLQGRRFTWQDDADHPLVAIVNQTMARDLWRGQDPLGRRIKLSGGPDAPWWTVVGVVNDIRQESLASPAQREFYIPYAQYAWYPWAHIVLRTEKTAAAVAAPLRRALGDLDPALPFEGVIPMNDRLSLSLTAPRFRAFLLSVFAAVALILAVGGLYGVLLHAVSRRTREVGIRMALGARPADLIGGVVREGMTLAAIGILLGLAGGLAVSRILSGFLYDVTPADPVTFAVVAGILVGAALVACLMPARRATRVDPMAALRAE